MKNSIQGGGAIAALYMGIAYIFGIIVFLFFLNPDTPLSGQEYLAFIIEHQTIFLLSNMLIYPVFGIALLFLTLALYHRMRDKDLFRAQIMAALGLIWSVLVISSGMIANVGLEKAITTFPEDPASAVALWTTLGTISEALGGGVEVVGGLWVLFISISGFKKAVFTKAFSILGLLVAIPGILTLIPGLGGLGAIFGILQIPWFFWLGILLSKSPAQNI